MIDKLSFSTPWSPRAFYYELMENKQALNLVAELRSFDDRKTVVGVSVTWVVLDEAHIATLAVHPAYRQLGIGRDLLAVTLQRAVERGAMSATLEVRSQNTVAQSLYRQFQFEIVGRRMRYYPDDHDDAILMTVDFRKHLVQGKPYVDWLGSVMPALR